MEKERRFLDRPVELRQEDGGPASISGYAAVYYDGTEDTQYPLWDGAVERILPGAFDGIDEGDIMALFNHEPNQVLGRSGAGTLRVAVDARGLHYEIAPGRTSVADDVREHIRRGDVSGSSFSFKVRDGGENWRREKDFSVRELRAVTVYDLGPVVAPAYAGTTAEARREGHIGEARRSFEAAETAAGTSVEEKRESLERRGIDARTWASVERAIDRCREGDRISRARANIQRRRCGAQHLGLWCCEPRWLGEAIAAVKAGMWPQVRAEDVDEDEIASGRGKYYSIHEGIALVRIEGQITKRGSSFGGASSIRVKQALRAARLDDAVEGILLVIDSPGGTVAGTDDLAELVRKIRARALKPIHAYVEDLGASAAYWIASQAERISAGPTALVGSIGTMAVVHDVSGAYKMSGIRVHLVSTGDSKGSFTAGLPVTDDQVSELREEVESLNGYFLRAVARGRGVKRKEVESWASGRCWISEEARARGLIDAVGDFDAAVEALKTQIFAQKKEQAETENQNG